MNIRQLIDLLRQFPDDMPVVVQSYEEGYDPITEVKELTIASVKNRQWYVGVYAEVDQVGQKALLIASKYNRADLVVSEDEQV